MTKFTKTAQVNLVKQGILPVQQLKLLAQHGIVTGSHNYPIEENQFQPNSIDLRLGERAYRVRCSFLPEEETVHSKIEKLKQYDFSIRDGAILEPNCVYIIPLLEQVHLPEGHHSTQINLFEEEQKETDSGLRHRYDISAKTNPKSTTGRLDIFTRVITDYSHRFEEIQPGYNGRLYLEVVPKSFPIRIKTGLRLNQLRIRHGYSFLRDREILQLHNGEPLLFDSDGQALPEEKLKVRNGLFMSVNLAGDTHNIVGYKARKHRELIDMELINHYPVTDFWEPIYAKPDDYLILEPEAFYIFASKERCRIPKQLAAEMVAYDTGSGELRTHYAGFFDSGFGGEVTDNGARAVLEVRSHDVPFLVEDGQTFCSLRFEPNTEVPDFIYGKKIKSNYQGQELKLGKHFKGN